MTPTSSPLDRVAGAYDAAVLAEARRGEPVSRSELAAALGVTPQAISKILSRLCDRGLMAEAGSIVTGPGKPTSLYRIVPPSRRAIGVHVSLRRLRSVIVDLTGEVIARHEVEIDPADGVDALVENIRAAVAHLSPLGEGDLEGIGVAMPGPVEWESGIFRGASSADPWLDAPMRDLLVDALEVGVVVDNDSNAAAVGETWSEPSLQNDAAVIVVEDGIGAGLRLNGDLVRGAHSRGGEVGHTVVRLDGVPCTCGRHGCAQAEFLAALDAGDPPAAARVLASVVVDLVRTVDVDRIVLGGRRVYEHHADFMDAVRTALRTELGTSPWMHVEVLLSTRGVDLVSVGAACEVLEEAYGMSRRTVGPA